MHETIRLVIVRVFQEPLIARNRSLVGGLRGGQDASLLRFTHEIDRITGYEREQEPRP